MTIMRRAFAVLAIALLSACTTMTTTHPIGIAKGMVEDERILGGWKFIPKDKDDKDQAFAFILKPETGPLHGLLVISTDNEWWDAELVAGKAGESGILNFHPLKKNGLDVEGADKIEGYFPLRYSVGADGTIALYLWTEDALKDAVQQNRIAGTVTTGAVTITAEPAALDAFFAGAAPTIFSEPYATLERIK